MATYLATKPDFTQGVWAQQGELSEPSTDKIAIGHIVERPPFQMVNWIENRQDQGIMYLFQNGFASWDRTLLYPVDAIVMRAGTLYQAINQNLSVEPSANPDTWKKSFFSSSDGEGVKKDLNSALNTDGFITFYVKKSDPVLDAVAKGVGFAFKEQPNTGLFLNENKNAVINKNGVETHSFETVTDVLNENNDKVVRMSDLRKVISSLQSFPIGSVFITVSNISPATSLGYGTWDKFSQGTVLVGQSDNANDPNWVRTAGSTFGENTHAITKGELPKVAVQLNATGYHRWIGNRDGVERKILNNEYYDGIDKDNSKNPMYTYPLGDGTPMNIVQPSVVVYMWKRTG